MKIRDLFRRRTMTNIVQAIDAMMALYTLIERTTAATGRIASKIKKAQREGRDLTDEEIQEIRSETDAAVEEARKRL